VTKRLADYPASGRPGRWPNTRELVVPGTPFMLPYCVKDDELWIIAVMHAARKWPE
jgi:toxin ParE1/3/4